MRIVYLSPCGNLGGAETSLRELLASIRVSEPDWELCLVLGEDGPLARVAHDLGVRVVLRAFPPRLARIGDAANSAPLWPLIAAAVPALRYSRDLAHLLGQIQPDIIHSNGLKMHLLGAWTRPRRTPLVWHIHDYVSSRRLMSRLLRLFSGACTAAIANSKSVARDLQLLMPGLRTAVIYNAVNLRRFSTTGNTLNLDTLSGLKPADPGTIRVGLVATFARWKGHQVFLDALARVSADIPIRGYIIGGPIYQTAGSQWSRLELERQANDLGLTGKVGFIDFLEGPDAAMRSLDIVVHASTQPEPFGMVIIEAMACGRAVIASQAGGAAELFVDGEDALSHPPGDAAALARQIELLSGNEELRARIGKAGRATAQRLYGTQRLAAELLEIYKNIALVSVTGPEVAVGK